jgi:cell wall integrity and stress response component
MFSSYGKVALAASWLLYRITTAEAAPNPMPQPETTDIPFADLDKRQMIPSPTVTPTGMRAFTSIGCFSTPEPMIDHGPGDFQATGNCQPICWALGMPVMGLVNGTSCWCGTQYPPEDTKVDDSMCNTPCNGYDPEMCGGANMWLIYNTGWSRNQIQYLPKESLTGTAGSPARTSSSSTGPSVVIVTQSNSAPAESKKGGGSNTVGIAVGVVVGVIAIVGLIGGVLFWLRFKRRREAEEEYKRQAAVNAFVNGGKGHNSTLSSSDSRLDPELLHARRESTGTIADNQDYSRRILKVRCCLPRSTRKACANEDTTGAKSR